MSDEALLIYTRRYLARNYLLAPQPNTYCRLPPINPITDIRDPFAFSSCDYLDAPYSPVFSPSEKLILEHETAIYLSSILTAPDEDKIFISQDLRRSKASRMEEPLVIEKRKKKVHRVKEDYLNEAPLGMGGDAGITWDRNTRRQVWDHVRDSEVERIIIGPEALQFLQDIHRPGTPPSTVEMMKEIGYCKPKTSKFMTPPLLPLSPIAFPSLRLDNVFDLKPLDAGKTSTLIDDLVAPFLAADSILVDPSPDSTLKFLQLLPPTPSPIRKRPRPETLMVETLLTPPTSTTKKVRFEDLELPPRINTPEYEDIENIVEGKSILIRVDRELAQEQLQEADSTLRIEVPVMDFSRPKPPWEKLENNFRSANDFKERLGLAARKWSGSGSVGMDLSWRPFIRSSIRIPSESLGDDELLNEFGPKIEEGNESERILIEGLRTLGLEGFNEEDMELELGAFTLKMDMETLITRKKTQKRSEAYNTIQAVVDDGGRIKSGKGPSPQKDTEILDKNPLDTFMALRSRVTKKSANTLNSRKIQINPEIEISTKSTTSAELIAIPVSPPFPVPKIQLPILPGAFIVSTTLLTERLLFKLIKELYPTAVIIERDFSVPILDTFAGIPLNQNHADTEADLLLSPLSGIIFTTLQKIRQAPLPGHTISTIRQRVINVAILYERLFVMVLGKVRSSDSQAVARFAAFAAALRGGVHVRIVDEDKNVVARWVIALMIREGSAARLLEEETLWERFLRKAGFNAFGAQVVLRECREGGLRGLLKMDIEEKRERFKGIVGDKVLERALRRLEGEWDA